MPTENAQEFKWGEFLEYSQLLFELYTIIGKINQIGTTTPRRMERFNTHHNYPWYYRGTS